MRNYWIGRWARKGTRAEIRSKLSNPIELDNDQIDMCINVVSEFFYTHRTSPAELAMEGCVLLCDVMLQRIRMMFPTGATAKLLADAEAAYKDWQIRVMTP
jgi:hypothetical protein